MKGIFKTGCGIAFGLSLFAVIATVAVVACGVLLAKGVNKAVSDLDKTAQSERCVRDKTAGPARVVEAQTRVAADATETVADTETFRELGPSYATTVALDHRSNANDATDVAHTYATAQACVP